MHAAVPTRGHELASLSYFFFIETPAMTAPYADTGSRLAKFNVVLVFEAVKDHVFFAYLPWRGSLPPDVSQVNVDD